MRTFISERNLREETLKQELASLQKQLEQTVKQNQETLEKVKVLKQDFKEKETKLLSDFSKLKTLKNKLEDKLYRQDLSKQALNMMIKHKRFSDEHSVNIIGDPSPNYCKKAKGVQCSIYDGNVLLEPVHDPPCVESSDETLKSAEESRDKMIEEMNDL